MRKPAVMCCRNLGTAFGLATDGKAATSIHLFLNIEIPAKWIAWREFAIAELLSGYYLTAK